MQEDVLEKIGMNKNEAKIYLFLLKKGTSTSGQISKATKIERNLTYRILTRMVDDGMVSYFNEARVKKFKAASPEVILTKLEEREKMFRGALPLLKNISEASEGDEPTIEIYRGISGIRTVVRRILSVKKDYCAIAGDFRNSSTNIFFTQLMKGLERENIHERVIVRKGTTIARSKNTQVRYLPEDQKFLSTTGIIGDYVGIIMWSEPSLAVIIKSKELAQTYQCYFELLWAISKKEN